MFKRVTDEVWAFDAEGIPDPIAGRLLCGLPDRYAPQSEINICIGKASPAEYMQEVIAQCNDKPLRYERLTDLPQRQKNLAANCPPASVYTMTIDGYDAFLEQRHWLMVQKIRDYYDSLEERALQTPHLSASSLGESHVNHTNRTSRCILVSVLSSRTLVQIHAANSLS